MDFDDSFFSKLSAVFNRHMYKRYLSHKQYVIQTIDRRCLSSSTTITTTVLKQKLSSFFEDYQITLPIKYTASLTAKAYSKMSNLFLFFLAAFAASEAASTGEKCTPSITTASGTHAPSSFCSGDIIFQEEFDYLNFKKWQHENTLGGGGVR